MSIQTLEFEHYYAYDFYFIPLEECYIIEITEEEAKLAYLSLFDRGFEYVGLLRMKPMRNF